MMHVLVALAALWGVGLAPALVIVPSRATACSAAPLVASLMWTLAGVLSLLTRLPFTVVLVMIGVLEVGAVVVLVRRARSGARRNRPAEDSTSGSWPIVIVAVMSGAPWLWSLRRPPIDWDARSIWFFHADWVWSGGRDFARALGNPAFDFSHAEYPPLVPSAIAGAWRIAGDRNHVTAQVTVAMLGLGLIALASTAVGRVAARLTNTRLGALGAAATTTLLFAASGPSSTNGLADVVGAAAVTGALVLLLVDDLDREHVWLGSLCLAAASLAKVESFAIAVVVAGLAFVRHRRDRRVGHERLAIVGSVVSGMAWTVIARLHGAHSYLTDDPAPGIDRRVSVRAEPIWSNIWQQTRWWFLGAAAATVVVLLGRLEPIRGIESAPGLARRGWRLAALAGATMLTALAYFATPLDLQWQLLNSVDRTTIVLRMSLGVEMLLMTALGAAAWRDWRSRPSAVDPGVTTIAAIDSVVTTTSAREPDWSVQHEPAVLG